MNAKAFGERLKAVREAKGMTQEQLSALVDIGPNHLSALERGVKLPRLETFVAIANTLGVSADMLLFEAVSESYQGKACELSDSIAGLPPKDRTRILKTIEAIIKA